MTTRLHTTDPELALTELRSTRRRAIRKILLERLTPTMYRRVSLLYGFDGPEMTERAAATAEGCARIRVRDSRDAAIDRLVRDWRLWLLWLWSGKSPDRPESRISEALGWEGQGLMERDLSEEERVELMMRGDMTVVRGRDQASMEEKYEAADPYLEASDAALAAFEAGEIDAAERDRLLLAALRSYVSPDGRAA